MITYLIVSSFLNFLGALLLAFAVVLRGRKNRLNLRFGVIDGPWTANLFARNLTDKRAEVSAINSSQDPDGLLTVRPRTIGVNLTRKF